jgi:hypothetical protein
MVILKKYLLALLSLFSLVSVTNAYHNADNVMFENMKKTAQYCGITYATLYTGATCFSVALVKALSDGKLSGSLYALKDISFKSYHLVNRTIPVIVPVAFSLSALKTYNDCFTHFPLKTVEHR